MVRSERDQTDESLRLERESADQSVREKLASIDAMADAVIRRARGLADELLAGARAKVDRYGATPPPLALSPRVALEAQRQLEDEVVRAERDAADRAVEKERAEHIARRPPERVETDKDLFSERARSDSAVATRDEFLGLVSHDLRNMLHGMIGFAELIEDEAQKAEVPLIATIAQRIHRSGGRMSRLVGDLVDIASIEAGKLAVTRVVDDPLAIVAEAVETFRELAEKSGVSIVTEMVAPALTTSFDPSRLLQVITNILSNAIKFTPPHGKVVIRVERTGDELLFSFTDTGVGIPPDQLDGVFDRFVQVTPNDRRGLGLGLYISRCIIEGHGGRIWAESSVGIGSTVSFTLPIDRLPS